VTTNAGYKRGNSLAPTTHGPKMTSETKLSGAMMTLIDLRTLDNQIWQDTLVKIQRFGESLKYILKRFEKKLNRKCVCVKPTIQYKNTKNNTCSKINTNDNVE